MSKLHYFALNEHTKYRPIRRELDDNNKYRIKNSQWLSFTYSLELSASQAYGKQLLFVPTCRIMLGFSYFPRPRPAIGTSLVNNRSRDRHSTDQNSCFLGGYIGELTERVP